MRHFLPTPIDPELLLQPLAILCLGHVDKFYDKPMLEQQQWANRKDLKDLLFENVWNNTPCR